MQVALDAPTRPAFRYYGGKFNLAPWIISFFPEHLHYIEPCAGACSVLLQKPRSSLETINDTDGNVVNFFRVLRDHPDELIRKIRLTPWAREEYKISLEIVGDQVERARRFFVRQSMNVQAADSATPGQVRFKSNEDASGVIPILHNPQLQYIANRFMRVQIENMPYQYIVAKFDREDALFYFDPPYVTETREGKRIYAHEFTNDDHRQAAELLHTIAGYVIISGYACPLYADLYERHGWQRHDKVAQTNSGGKRTESVWLSPRTVEALARPQQQGLFG